MQISEILFLGLLAVLIFRLVAGPVHPLLRYSYLTLLGAVILLAGLLLESLRWQMYPACIAFVLVALGSIRSRPAPVAWRIAGALPVTVLLVSSAVLTHQLPLFEYPTPGGPHAVGTFDYSITDPDRIERYAPERNRELYVEVWYPAPSAGIDAYPVTTLYHELYEGDTYWFGWLLGYLKHVPTHSHVAAPVAGNGDTQFPVLLFSHGGMGFTSQNHQLMEHLASHGYVILSIAHPYDSTMVNLASAGSVRLSYGQPPDLPFDLEGMERNILGKIREDAGLLADGDTSPVRAQLLAIADVHARAETDEERLAIAASAIENELAAYAHLMTPSTLSENLDVISVYQHSLIDYRVQDVQFVADAISEISAPIAGFHDSLDQTGFGVFGMSLGGATAGEFCKIDTRCLAATNLDGTQLGRHWNTPVPVPFLMFYHEAHQGGNDFAYLPPANDFHDYAVVGTEHYDFMEFAHTFPILQRLGLTGPIDKARMIAIVNEVQLNFFDRYLKGEPVQGELFKEIPEIIIRRHQQ